MINMPGEKQSNQPKKVIAYPVGRQVVTRELVVEVDRETAGDIVTYLPQEAPVEAITALASGCYDDRTCLAVAAIDYEDPSAIYVSFYNITDEVIGGDEYGNPDSRRTQGSPFVQPRLKVDLSFLRECQDEDRKEIKQVIPGAPASKECPYHKHSSKHS